MRSTYRAIAGLIALGVLVQAAAIGFGWFDVINKVDEGSLVLDSDYEGNAGHTIHGMNGMMVMPLLGLLLLVTSFFTKLPGASRWGGAVFAAIIVQIALAFVAFGAPVVGALHGMNALVVFTLAFLTARRVKTVSAATAAARTASVPAQSSPTDAAVGDRV